MSLGTTEADVSIVLEARDNATVVIEDAAKRINRSYRDMRNEQRAVQRQFELTNRTFVATARIFTSVGSIINRVRGLYNTFLLQQIRNEQTARSLRDAQKALNDALVQFGPNSREAIDAMEDLLDVQKRQKREQEEQILSWLFAIGILGSFGTSIVRLIGRIKIFNRQIGLTKAPPPTTPVKSPVAGITPKPPAAPAPSLQARLVEQFSKFLKSAGTAAGGAAKIGGTLGPAAILFLAQLAGEQQAAAPVIGQENPDLPTGFGALEVLINRIVELLDQQGQLLGKEGTAAFEKTQRDIDQIVTNIFNINVPTTDEMISAIENSVKRATTFGQSE